MTISTFSFFQLVHYLLSQDLDNYSWLVCPCSASVWLCSWDWKWQGFMNNVTVDHIYIFLIFSNWDIPEKNTIICQCGRRMWVAIWILNLYSCPPIPLLQTFTFILQHFSPFENFHPFFFILNVFLTAGKTCRLSSISCSFIFPEMRFWTIFMALQHVLR